MCVNKVRECKTVFCFSSSGANRDKYCTCNEKHVVFFTLRGKTNKHEPWNTPLTPINSQRIYFASLLHKIKLHSILLRLSSRPLCGAIGCFAPWHQKVRLHFIATLHRWLFSCNRTTRRVLFLLHKSHFTLLVMLMCRNHFFSTPRRGLAHLKR